MKQYGLIQTVCLAAVALGVAACSQDELLTSNEGVEGAAVTFTATGITMPQVETRATTDGTWEDTQSVGIRISGTTKEYAVTPNSADPTKATLSVAEGSTSFHWTSATETKNVEAWYPYTDGQTTMPNVVVQQNQSVEANYVASDLLSAAQTVTYGDTDLQFTHRTAKITLNISAAEEGILDNAKVMLCNLSTANGNPSSIRCLNTSAGGSYTYQALVSPQTFAANTEFFKLLFADGRVDNYTPNTDLEFNGGYQYDFNITLLDKKLIVSPPNVIPWLSGNTGSGNIYKYNLANGDYYLSGQKSGGFRHYFVGTEAGLKAWAEYVNDGNINTNCTLLKDINLTINADGSNNWLRIGTRKYPYTGTFDGAGHKIDNIIFKSNDFNDKVSLFSWSSGIIKNLTIGENSYFEVTHDGCTMGSIVSSMGEVDTHGQIINCHSKATLKSTSNSSIGGIVGDASTYQNYSHLLIGCSFSGNITGSSATHSVGGIVGDASNNQPVDHGNDLLYSLYMIGCYSTGKINISCNQYSSLGGIVGHATCYGYGRVAYLGCYSTAEGLSDSNAGYLGGLIGEKYTQKEGTQHYLSSCYWSNYTGNSVGRLTGGSADQNTAFVDGENINWATATANMNAAIKEWNNEYDNLCSYHYEQKNGTNNPPTLVEGAPN